MNLSKKLQFLEKFGLGFARTGNKFLSDRHWAAARWLPTTGLGQSLGEPKCFVLMSTWIRNAGKRVENLVFS